MGIRLDQLHDEVFTKIAQDISAQRGDVLDYLDTRISEIDIIFGLPETTHVERDVETNKRNLEKSGFIEINRNFVPFRTGEQGDTGVWVSNLNTNESPFEPRTIDGQKRGISVGGHILNYTVGNIGQDIDNMMNLPIAPNLPVFFPEDNDMIMEFSPSKVVIHEQTVTDTSVEISITKRITDENRIDLSKMIENDVTKYYYMDEDSFVYFLDDEGRSYLQTDPDTKLIEEYTPFNDSFGGTFSFEKIFDDNAVVKYVDEDSKLFEFKTPIGDNATKVNLESDSKQVYLEDVEVTETVMVDGVEQEETSTKTRLVTNEVQSYSLDGLENHALVKTLVSDMDFERITATLVDEGDEYTYISDKGIRMFVESAQIHYYNHRTKDVLDDDGNSIEVASDSTVLKRAAITNEYSVVAAGYVEVTRYYQVEIDEEYRTYLPIGSDAPVSGEIKADDINTNDADDMRPVHTITTQVVSYYRVDTMAKVTTGNTYDVVELDINGVVINDKDDQGNEVTVTQDLNKKFVLTAENKLAINLLDDDGNVTATIVTNEGKIFHYHHEIGTKYYRKFVNNDIYYVDTFGTLYTPDQDVQEIFEGTVFNVDTLDSANKMFYSANGLMFFIDGENLRTYVQDEMYQQIQLTDLNGYRVFEKADGSNVYIVSYNVFEGTTKMVTIANNANGEPVETEVNVSYDDMMPLFETDDIEEAILNLVIPVSFNIVQGNVVLTRDGNKLAKYSDYNVDAILSLSKELEFNEDKGIDGLLIGGDTLRIPRVGMKDIILRLEKKGTLEDDVEGHWANNTGDIVMPEYLTGNNFHWTEGEELSVGQQLDFNDIVKATDERYYQYTGSAISYEDMGADKTITVDPNGVFWEDVTVHELEYERKGQNYKIFSVDEGETIRFTVIRRVWEQHPVTGEMTVIEKVPYVLEKTAAQNGENLFVLEDANFNLDDNATLESYILLVENIKYYSTYEGNRANDFLLTLTGMQTVAKNEDSAMIYSDDYFLSDFVLYLTDGEMSDEMVLTRVQAPQAELKIDFNSIMEQPIVNVPFDIIKNKFDIVVPQTLDGHEYTWIMGEPIPVGRTLMNGDVIFDKDNIKFYTYNGNSAAQEVNPIPRESLMSLPIDVQKELLRQMNKFPQNLNTGLYWLEFNQFWAEEAEKLAVNDGLSLTFLVEGENSAMVLNEDDAQVVEYLTLARANMIEASEHMMNDAYVDANVNIVTGYMTAENITEIKRILNTNLNQFVLKSIKYNAEGEPALDDEGNQEYVYEYTRNFMVETIVNDDPTSVRYGEEYFITRNINTGIETELEDVWTDITAEEVGYYRFGKTFTILETKAKDEVVVRLLETGAEEFTSKRVISEGGEITFAIDFNIEEEDGTEIGFEVIYEEINWTDGVDYIQEGQDVTLNMIEEAGQNVIIRRNDEFDLIDLVVLERKDLVFIETWHEPVSETGFIFPFGNVQFQGNMSDDVVTSTFDHKFYDTIAGETSEIKDGAKKYCQMYQKGDIVYNYYAGNDFTPANTVEKKFVDETFAEDATIGKGWKLADLQDEDRKTIFTNSDHNLYYDGEALIQVRYRTRVVGLNLFNNYFKGTSDYMSEGLRFQGSSPITSRIVTREIGEYTSQDGDGSMAGQPITETIQQFAGDNLIISSSPNSLLYKEGKLYDDALFTVEGPTELSHNGYVHAVPVAIINRRNQGVYHPEFNENGTGFFINGIYVSEDKEDFADDITGFTLVDENAATLETSSVGRDRKAKFKVMLEWLFSTDYKAGGSMVSKTTYRPDGLLYDEINTRDIIDLRIDANDQRKRIEDLESDVEKGFKELADLTEETGIKFEQTTNYINTTANLIYKHIAATEAAVRKDMDAKDAELTAGLEETNTNLADLSANVFSKDVTTNLLIDTMVGVISDMDGDAFDTFRNDSSINPDGLPKPDKEYLEGMINAFVENMEGAYTRNEFMKFFSTVLKSVTDKTMLTASEMDLWIKRLSVKDLNIDADPVSYTRAETLELIYEGLTLASSARILPPSGADNIENWGWQAIRYDGWLGTKNLDLTKDFLENGKTPVDTKTVKTTDFSDKTYQDISGNEWNKGYIPGPTIWGNVHNYHALYTTWFFVDKPFTVENVKMNGDDPHAIYINGDLVARNKYCCRDTAYTYEFRLAGWYRVDAMYSEKSGGHYVQLGWNPSDYQDKIKYMTTTNMDADVEVTKMRLDNWASKLKTLASTIKGDASGEFTKLEVKLILIKGLGMIRDHILDYGTEVTQDDLDTFHGDGDGGLENFIENFSFTDLGYDAYAEDKADTDIDETLWNSFRPLPDMTGSYNKDEVVEIIRKGLQLVNGIDSISGADVQKWVDRLNIAIEMDSTMYFTATQVDALIKDGINYLAGLDSATSYEIGAWLDKHISDHNTIFVDSNGISKAISTVITDTQNASYVYSKVKVKEKISEKFKAILGAQAAKTTS